MSSHFPLYIPFSDFFNSWRVYFYFEPIETAYVRSADYRAIDEQTLKTIRLALIDLTIEQYTSKLTYSDFKLIFSTVNSVQDLPQKHDLLSFIKSLSQKSDFSQILSEILLVLNNLLLSSDENDVISTFEIMLSFHKYGLIKKFSISQHFELIYQHLLSITISASLFEKLCSLYCPPMFPLCCFFAIFLGEQTLIKFIQNLEPDEDICSTPHWAFWPLYAAVHFEKDVFDLIICFLLKCKSAEWLNLYIFLTYICQSLQKSTESYQHDFLVHLSNYIIKESKYFDQAPVFDALTILTHFILFRPNRTHMFPCTLR